MYDTDNLDESSKRESSKTDSTKMENTDKPIPTSTPNDYHPGAACSELLNNEISEIEDLNNEEVDDYGSFPMPPPPNSPISQMVYNDLFRSSITTRRLSYFPINSENVPTLYTRDRAPSLPIILMTQIGRGNPEPFLKKLLFDSRRSSIESAYHSHGSGRSSRTLRASVQLEDMDYSQDYSDTLFSLTTQSILEEMVLDDNLGRRDSLSYEAIREYFLEINPYMNPIDIESPCSDHINDPSTSLFCPHCRIRRFSIDATNIYFRTSAHRMVVERQFEELFNIPDPSRSRSTSVDLFGDIGIQFALQDKPDSPTEPIDDEKEHVPDEKS